MTISLLLLPILFLPAIAATVSDVEVPPDCQKPFECGNITVQYPFYHQGNNETESNFSVCGYLGFGMVCENNILYRAISNDGYKITNINQTTKTATIVDTDTIESNCHIPKRNFTLPPYADYTTVVSNLTFFFDCSRNSTTPDDYRIACYGDNSSASSYVFPEGNGYALFPEDCKAVIVAPVLRSNVEKEGTNLTRNFGKVLQLGFELNWINLVSKSCTECEKSQGRCGSANGSQGYETFCYCNDGQHTLSCSNHEGGRLSTPKKVLIGVCASVVGLVFLVASCWVVLLYSRNRRKMKKRSSSQFTSLVRCIFDGSSTSDNLNNTYSETHIFSYKELEEATDGFSPAKEIGDGGFGVVYKGILGDGRTVAVKRSYENNFRREEQFRNEIAILKHIRHPNLVSLYGCTDRDSQQLLVYEFVPNGTVADHLDGPRAAEGGGRLTWSSRMNIAVEVADALSYLHSFVPQIIHRDVKTNNILLDNDYHVKVADFGLSRLFPLDVTHVSTAPQGTPGYVDPEYYQCYQLTDKSDVFSFGVVLVELISSKPAVDIRRSRQEINLSNMAMNRISNGLVHELADPMLGYETDPEVRRTIEQVAEVAFLCLQADRDMRPPMKDVKGKLVDIVNDSKQRAVDGRMMTSCSHITLSTADTVTVDWHSSSSDSIPKTDA